MSEINPGKEDMHIMKLRQRILEKIEKELVTNLKHNQHKDQFTNRPLPLDF